MKKRFQIIAYGAGKKCHDLLPVLLRKCTIDAIWDKNVSADQSIHGIDVCFPEPVSEDAGCTLIVVFISDPFVRNKAINELAGFGYKHIYGFNEFLNLLRCGMCVYDITKRFCVVDYKSIEAVFYALPADDDIDICYAKELELYLRAKANEKRYSVSRPINMVFDGFYDPFLLVELTEEWFSYKRINEDEKRRILGKLYELSYENETIVAVYCHSLLCNGEYNKAESIIKSALHKSPNSLLLDTCVDEIVEKSIEKGFETSFPKIDYDLTDRFCYSGMTLGVIDGINADGSPSMIPCFRGHQCAAKPEGEAWCGGEWTEFRKSLLDGSFRYCQKYNCPNILSGWLPKKKEINAAWLRNMESGDFSETPPLEELHLSYDNHCNLQCRSCRTEFQTCDNFRKAFLDNMYEIFLKEKLKKTKHLTLSGCGEALISPHSLQILRSFSKMNNPELCVELRTNVVSVTKRTWESLGLGREVIKHITASVDGATKETFEALRYPAKWEKMLDGLCFISELRRMGEIDLFEIHVVVQDANISELMDVAKLAEEYGADVVTYSRLVNWRDMSQEEYDRVNPFFVDHPRHQLLIQEIDKLIEYRDELNRAGKNPRFINIHGVPDASDSYDVIRNGRLKIR